MILLGCGKDAPTKPPSQTPFVYPTRSTPENALLYMAAAFERRDSVRTDSVYADEYEGSSVDMTDPIPLVFHFPESDEVRIVSKMSQSSSISFIRVDFGSTNTWLRSHTVADPPEWVTLQIPSFIIEVHDAIEGEFRTSAPSPGVTQVFEFTLKPTTPDSTSPTDTTWVIVRWVESRSQL